MWRRAMAALCMAVAVSACGGGGGGSPDAATAPPSSGSSVMPTVQNVGTSEPDPASWLSCPSVVHTTLGQPVTLACEKLIAELTLATEWSLISAPSGFSLLPSGGLTVSFVATHVGEHRMQVRSVSGSAERVSSVVLHVDLPPNQAPSLGCPAEVTGQSAQAVLVSCTATDDGQPAGSTLASQWEVVTSPAPVTLGGAQTLEARFVPSAAGAYRLRLTTSDGGLASSADVLVTVKPPPNTPPSVTCPAAVQGTAGQDVAISCSATDDGQPAGATLSPRWVLVSAAGAAQLTGQESFNARLNATVPGEYRLRLTVGDGALVTSSEVAVTLAPPPNQAPTVSCPSKLSGRVQQELALTCSTSDDGQPAGKSLTTAWTHVSGPSTPALTGAQTTSASFTPTKAGTYRLRFTASDSALSASADVLVEVGAAPNLAPVVSCPASVTGRSQQPVAMTCTVKDDGQPADAVLAAAWTVVSSPASVALGGAQSLGASFTPTVPGTYRFRLRVSDGDQAGTADLVAEISLPPNQAPRLSCPTALTGTAGQAVSLSCTAADDGQPAGQALTPVWTQLSGVPLALMGANTLATAFTPTAAGSYRFMLSVSDSQLATTAEVAVTVDPPPNRAPVVTCPSQVSGHVGQEVGVSCTAVDDGLPTGSSLLPSWQFLTGPAPATLATPKTTGTRFTPTQPGTYKLRLGVSDGGLSSSADVDVVVTYPPKLAPSISCPTQLTGVAGVESTVACSAAPNGGAPGALLSYAWTLVSGPAVSLLDAGTDRVRLTPADAGTFRLRLTVTDGAFSSSSDVTLVAALPPNQAPRLTCPATLSGQAQQEVVIACTASDDGQPAGKSLVPAWTFVSGPVTPTLATPGTLTTRFTPAQAGTYRLALQVSDTLLSSTANVTVTVSPPPNQAPTVSCPSTFNGTTQQEVVITCTAADDGQPAGKTLVPTWSVTSAPATTTLATPGTLGTRFTPTQPGTYRLKLSVSDSLLVGSADVTVSVALPPNLAPVVSCPATLNGTTQQEVAISCTTTDDGQPAGKALVPSWTQVSGPATLSLGGAATLGARFTPTVAGTYRLRLSVGDTLLTGSADVTVTVSLPPNQAPSVTCPATLSGLNRQEIVVTCTARDDGQPAGSSLRPSWTVLSSAGTTNLIGADTFSVRFTPTKTGAYRLRFAVTDGALPTTADVAITVSAPPNLVPRLTCPSLVNGTVGQATSVACSASDDGEPEGAVLSYAWSVVSGPETPVLTGAGSANARFTPTQVGSYLLRLTVSDTQLTASADVTVQIAALPNAAPVLTCPASQNGQTGSDVVVQCTVTDDGLPAGGSLAPSWSLESSPGAVTLDNRNTLAVRFRPAAAGLYALKLTVSDGDRSSEAQVRVTVTVPPNQAPRVTCPSTASGTVGTAVNLSCTVTDDGQPTAAAPALAWSTVSSPATVTFSAPSLASTSFTPSATGSYRVRLTASDTQLSTAAEVVVTVTPPPNVAPTVTCPASVSVRVNRPLSVSCTFTDDGLPAGSTLTPSWSWTLGPASPALTPAGSTSVGATPTVEGTYRLRLSVSDGLLSGTGEVEVRVLPPITWRIHPLGASIVNGWGGQQSFRYPLWTKLVDAHVTVDMVGSTTAVDGGTPVYPDYKGLVFDRQHEGHSGFTTGQIASNLPAWMANYVSDVTVFHAGTNDLLQRGQAAIDPALLNLNSIVQTLRAKNADVQVYVAKLIPVDPTNPAWPAGSGDYSQTPAHIVAFNDRLAAWAASISTSRSPVRIVDLHTGFNAKTDTFDGIHPNTAGQEKMAEGFFRAIVGGL